MCQGQRERGCRVMFPFLSSFPRSLLPCNSQRRLPPHFLPFFLLLSLIHGAFILCYLPAFILFPLSFPPSLHTPYGFPMWGTSYYSLPPVFFYFPDERNKCINCSPGSYSSIIDLIRLIQWYLMLPGDTHVFNCTTRTL